jgi:hypothetical protein
MKQDDNGLVYFATKRGILQFDGRNWELLSSEGPIYTLQIASNEKVFWGGANGFGYIGIDTDGLQKTITVSGNGVQNVFQSVLIKSDVYFLNDKVLYALSSDSLKPDQKIQASKETGAFISMLELFGTLYISTERMGTLKMENDKLVKGKLTLPEDAEIIFANRMDDTYIIGTATNHIYRCTSALSPTEITLQDEDYIRSSVVITGSWINSNLIALGTLRGGVAFVNPKNGKTEQLVNYNTGLPDNEVFSLMRDHNENLWIAHDYGFTRVSPYMPLRAFNHYSGLQGNLLCAASFQHQVYVGTSLGLFKLEKEDSYDEMEYYVTVKIPEKRNKAGRNRSVVTPASEKPVSVNVQPPKRGFLWFLKKDKTKAALENTGSSKPSVEKLKPGYRQERRTQKILRTSQFVFRKVSGINAKVTQLVETNGKLISGGLDGLHEINNTQAKLILDEPVRFMFINSKVFIASTYGGKINALQLVNGTWQIKPFIKGFDDEISYIFEGAQQDIWLTSFDRIYRLHVSDNPQAEDVKPVALPNTNFGESVGISWNNETVLANAEGFFRLDRNKFIKIDTLPKPQTYFAWGNSLLYRDEHRWRSIGENSLANLQLLNLFQDMRYISADRRLNSLWLISSTNELYRFFGQKRQDYSAGYPLMLKSVRNGNKNINPGNIQLDERESALSFKVVQPMYVGARALEYRYFLEGLNQDWSAWSAGNDVVDFPYLPTGNYKFKVQSKDIFGEVKDMRPLAILVQPPYWQRLWFYALEFAFFASLVLLSLKLSTKYNLISRILSLLTIILLIQFIQTVAVVSFTPTSPVIDFFIQFLIALLILPVEGYLRKLMLRSHDQSIALGLRELINSKIKNKVQNDNR